MNPQVRNAAPYYLGFLRHLSTDAKLDLIAQLSQSLKQELTPVAPDLQSLFGAYHGPETAEELIASVRSASNPPKFTCTSRNAPTHPHPLDSLNL